MNQTGTAKVLVPTGMLGAGFDPSTVDRGIALGADVIAVDGGSTDSGPHYLGQAVAKTAAAAVARDLDVLVRAAKRAGIPLIVGSCGTSGTDTGVDWIAEMVRSISNDIDETVTVARIYSEQDTEAVAQYVRSGRVHPLPPAGELDEATARRCSHIVGLMGHEPIADAVLRGADVVLAGRATDTAVLSAVPLLRGCPPGPVWHSSKIAECGGLCTTTPLRGGVLVSIDPDGFTIEPLDPDIACTPQSVAAHMLYENVDPFRMREPAGTVDARGATYVALDERRVRVEGSQFIPADVHTVKLEGSGVTGYETLSLVGIRDPEILDAIEIWSKTFDTRLAARVSALLNLDPSQYDLVTRYYGWNAVLGSLDPDTTTPPREVGVVLRVRAHDQATATAIAKIANPMMLHLPLPGMSHLPSYAFLTSPAELERGPVYEFLLQHAVDVEDPTELFRTEIEVINHA
ncbi:acyclic terpene utilization AtuA family protein [Rhodococcus opacus]|jgi:hypothetical protein|uniref:Acyclic terpene utilisation N-terminal domain-containing protein n=1 Tax=Rhodococcus opacus TaxID=37919 RepID=A0A2S8J900_RHOOP|nr:acyclic terpene utilization AtuA family protein [Rhodococcus opacus]PQP23518.1 hypothetical protein C5613_18400 [Rhodococcus opacus]